MDQDGLSTACGLIQPACLRLVMRRSRCLAALEPGRLASPSSLDEPGRPQAEQGSSRVTNPGESRAVTNVGRFPDESPAQMLSPSDSAGQIADGNVDDCPGIRRCDVRRPQRPDGAPVFTRVDEPVVRVVLRASIPRR